MTDGDVIRGMQEAADAETDEAVEEMRLNILDSLERTVARKDIRSVDVQLQIAALLRCRTAQDCEALLNQQWRIDRG